MFYYSSIAFDEKPKKLKKPPVSLGKSGLD
jgi:hypothetical protein